MTVLAPTSWLQVVEAISACHAPLEVTLARAGERNAFAPLCRVRVLHFDPGGLVIESPPGADMAAACEPPARLRLLLGEGPQRWELVAPVLGPTLYPREQAAPRPALRLGPPESICRAPRRAHDRVPTGEVALPPIRLLPLDEGDAHDVAGRIGPPWPQFPPQPFAARLLNVGIGGLGLEAPPRVAEQLPRVRRYLCRLEVPIGGEPLELPARLVHLEALGGGTHYLGLAFVFAGAAEQRAAEERLAEITAWLLRRQLQPA